MRGEKDYGIDFMPVLQKNDQRYGGNLYSLRAAAPAGAASGDATRTSTTRAGKRKRRADGVGGAKNEELRRFVFRRKETAARQFNAKYPQYAKYDERDLFAKKSKIFEWIFFVATLLVCILMIKLSIKYSGVDDKKATACTIVLFVVFVAFCISDTVENIVRMKQRKKRLRVLKLYVKWLHDEKGVVYKVKFDKQYAGLKQYYDRINVDYEKI